MSFLKSKFRALGMVIIDVIMGKRISLVENELKNLSSESISFEDAKEIFKSIRYKFQKFLKEPQILKKMDIAQTRDQVDYLSFLKKVFIDNCEGMTWGSVIDDLIP